MALTFQRLGPEQFGLGTELAVAPEQLEFTGTVGEALVQLGDYRHPHGIWRDELLVGFFIVDTNFAAEFDFCDEGDLGIRTFLIDSRYQGQGLGKAAAGAIKPFLETSYPDFGTVWLTVNCRNRGAYLCYEAGGFSDTGDCYLGGAAGPQHVMRLALGTVSLTMLN